MSLTTNEIIELGNAAFFGSLQVLKNKAEAQDVAHTVIERFIKASQEGELHLGSPSGAGWVSGRNMALDDIRHQKMSREKMPRIYAWENTHSLFAEREVFETLTIVEALDLTNQQKVICAMAAYGFSSKEIRDSLNLTTGSYYTERSRIARAFKSEGIFSPRKEVAFV